MVKVRWDVHTANPVGDLKNVKNDLVTQTYQLIDQRDQLLSALEALILFTKPTKSNAAALANAHRVIQELKL